jgi:hypothetical protein
MDILPTVERQAVIEYNAVSLVAWIRRDVRTHSPSFWFHGVYLS